MSTAQIRVGRRSFDLAPLFQFVAAAPLTCLVSLAAIVIGLWPSCRALLELEHSTVAAGEWWRLFTGHLAHCNGEHLFWDLLMFALLGWICERRSRTAYAICLASAAVAISVGMLWASPLSYRGLSGLATTSFALLAAGLLREQITAGNRGRAVLMASLIAGLSIKIGYEFWSGQCILTSAAGSFTPQPFSHVLGALVGLVVGLVAKSE
jgi:rhomboid family GlyGly-CTERM serine protease